LVTGEFVLVTAKQILNEVQRNLGKDFLRRSLPDEALAELTSATIQGSELVPLVKMVAGIASHPEDDLVLATLVNSEATHLVSGDRQLIALGSFEGADIVSPRHFLALLESQKLGG